MDCNELIIGFGILVAVILFLMLGSRSGKTESFEQKKLIDTCCTPFIHPNMYAPICDDPFSWGYTYSTGQCPKVYYPLDRQLPSNCAPLPQRNQLLIVDPSDPTKAFPIKFD